MQLRNPLRWLRAFAACGMFLYCLAGPLPPAAEAQGPNSGAPNLLLPIAFEAQLGSVRKSASEQYAKIRQAIDAFQELADQGKIKQVGGVQIEAVNLEIMQFERAGDQLSAWGEMCGNDIGFRAQACKMQLTTLSSLRAAERDFSRGLQVRLKKLEADLAAAQRRLPNVTRMIERKQPLQAQQEYWRTTDSIVSGKIWYGMKSSPAPPTALNSLDAYSNACYFATQKMWKAQALEACNKQLAALSPDYSGLIQRADQAAAAVASGNLADVGGKKFGGPGAVEALGELWREAEAQTVHARGWAMYNMRLGGSNSPGAVGAPQTGFSRNMAAALGRIIEADAGKVSPEQAPALYREYLDKLAPLLTQVADPAVVAALETPLQKLAARSPTFQPQCQAYRYATDDLLRWRARSTTAAVVARMQTCPPVAGLARTIASSFVENRGPFLVNEQSRLVARMTAAVPKLFETMQPMQDKPATAGDLLAVTPGGPMVLGAYQQPIRCYVRTLPAVLAAPAAGLASDLWVTDAQPPLTLTARMAIESSKQGDVDAAGGPISRLGLAAWGEHFAMLPTKQRGMIRLRSLPPDAPERDELVVLVLIDATWMAGKYYFVEPGPKK